VITIELNILNVDPTISLDGTKITSNDSLSHHQWVDCDNDYSLISGKTGQSFITEKEGNYAVIVSYGWCADTSECVFVNTTDLIINTFESTIRLYPNPTNGLFSIDLGKVYTNAEVMITGLDGRIIQKVFSNNAQVINLSMAAAPGIYMVTITSGNERAVFRIIKNL
jgi:hypothetical protein